VAGKLAGIDPLFDAGIRNWLLSYAKKNYWRVAAWYDWDDLVQDGYLCFYKCRRHYPEVSDPKHMMALVKVTYVRHIINLANQRTHTLDIPASDLMDADGDALWENLLSLGVEHEEASLYTLLAKAPPEVRSVLRLFFTETGRRQFNRPVRRINGLRETTNEFLCRLLGYNPNQINLVVRVQNFIQHGA
jgi:hypothetical protein